MKKLWADFFELFRVSLVVNAPDVLLNSYPDFTPTIGNTFSDSKNYFRFPRTDLKLPRIFKNFHELFENSEKYLTYLMCLIEYVPLCYILILKQFKMKIILATTLAITIVFQSINQKYIFLIHVFFNKHPSC